MGHSRSDPQLVCRVAFQGMEGAWKSLSLSVLNRNVATSGATDTCGCCAFRTIANLDLTVMLAAGGV